MLFISSYLREERYINLPSVRDKYKVIFDSLSSPLQRSMHVVAEDDPDWDVFNSSVGCVEDQMDAEVVISETDVSLPPANATLGKMLKGEMFFKNKEDEKDGVSFSKVRVPIEKIKSVVGVSYGVSVCSHIGKWRIAPST